MAARGLGFLEKQIEHSTISDQRSALSIQHSAFSQYAFSSHGKPKYFLDIHRGTAMWELEQLAAG
jgi:hypothetical protein